VGSGAGAGSRMSAGKGMSWRGGTGRGSGEGESLTVRISGLVGRVHLVDALASWLGDWQAKYCMASLIEVWKTVAAWATMAVWTALCRCSSSVLAWARALAIRIGVGVLAG